jgi:hypothetical protein
MTDTKVYRVEFEIPVHGSVLEERDEIAKLASLSALKAEVEKAGGTFADSIVRKTGSRVLKHVPAKPAPRE